MSSHQSPAHCSVHKAPIYPFFIHPPFTCSSAYLSISHLIILLPFGRPSILLFLDHPTYLVVCHLPCLHPTHCLPAAASMRSSPSASSSGSRVPALLRSTGRSCSNVFAVSSRAPAPAFRKWSADSMSLRPLFFVPSSRLSVRMRR